MSTIDKTEDSELELLVDNLRYYLHGDDYDFTKREKAVKLVEAYATTKAEQLATDIMHGLKGLEIDLQATEKHIESTDLTGDEFDERMLQVELEADDRKDVLDDVRALIQKLREASNV